MTRRHATPRPSNAAEVEITDLSFLYPDGSIGLDGLTLRVPAGERLALLGPNGAGKTTLAQHLNGLKTAQRGSVRVDDMLIETATLPIIRQRVQLLFSSSDEQLFMPTVAEDVAFGPNNFDLDPELVDERVASALSAVGASDLAGRVPHRLSTGEKRRAALAGILAIQPDVLVLDEPVAGLDPAGKRQLAQYLGQLGQTQIVITHDLSFALELCPTAAIINNGRLQAIGPTVELLTDQELLRQNSLDLPFGFRLDRLDATPSASAERPGLRKS